MPPTRTSGGGFRFDAGKGDYDTARRPSAAYRSPERALAPRDSFLSISRAHGRPFTFAVIGHNESANLAGALAQAFDAAEDGDRVCFIDSASTDTSAEIAASLGAEVIVAPLGKGRAMATALSHCRDGYICFIDADLEYSSSNIPAALRAATVASGADMVIGDYETERRRSVTPAIYRPLVGALFPSAAHFKQPLSGFRALNAELELGEWPPGYGIETHLNLVLVAAGRSVATTDLGFYRGPLRGYANVPAIGRDVAAAILDFAEEQELLDRAARPGWDSWVFDVIAAIEAQPPVEASDEEYLAALDALAARPLPPRVGDPGLEPGTSSLSEKRSNRLS